MTFNTAFIPLTALGLLLTAGSAPAHDDHGHREAGAHVHGVAQMDLVVDNGAIAINLNSPAADIVGFEYAPRDDDDRDALRAAKAKLEDGAALFQPTEAARCELVRTEVRSDQLHGDVRSGHGDDHDHGHDHGDDHDHGHGDDHQHADFHAEYRFDCAQGDALTDLTTTFFEVFDGSESMVVRMITPDRQTRVELNPDRDRLRL